MNAGTDTAPSGPDDEGRPDAGSSYRDNQQRLEQGLAFMGRVGGDVNVIIGAPPDEDVAESIVKPRLREGPYPADDVHARLRGFVEPPAYAQCRKVLDSHILLLSAHTGTGASTAAFALLADRYGAGGITGLDSPDDLSRWRPKEGRGYLLQGLSPRAAASLSEVVLTALAALLRRAGAHLVVTVRADTALPGDTAPWQVVHRPPSPDEVATKHLNAMAAAGELTPEQGADALGHLVSADFTGYLNERPLPRDGVEVAKALRDLALSGTPAASVLDELKAGGLSEARRALADSSHRADRLSLMAAISLLPGQDRTVIEEFSAMLRPRIDERGGPAGGMARQPEHIGTPGALPEGSHTRRDVLGPAFEDRLTAVGAHSLPLRFGTAQRYPVQPVAFSGRHRSEALLRCLWLDYEGMAGLLWKTLDEAPHHSGIELAAGQAIGKVLAHATGPGTLRQLHFFATSDKRWRRRLVAYALGEMVQHPALTGAVRDQLRQWSRAAPVPLRCTVAETCAGSYGLARPARALKLLDAVLDKPDPPLEPNLRSAVSFALSTLLSEDAHHALVFDQLREWQGADPGTPRHALAVHVLASMSSAAFPLPGAPGVRRVRLADLLADHPARAFDLVVAALDDPATHEATATGLSLIESDPDLRHRTGFPRFLAALSGAARNHRGVLRFVLRRHRVHTASSAEGFAS
ncbi:hypothetical protein OG863_11350 [Streptomyces decoyicus]|uniref:PBS lyase n=1 Tax=Streptomyces decoyicus TaxID=249567 RepID=A0ABZ1FDQ9_9ACTN|nr:hypothetical protein [Streptomyces decoyicus]WSB68505.1 hypothetical protein OG863_11350 [Streptomyces decoyicus]